MAIQLSVDVRDDRLDAIEAAIGTSAKLKIWSGAPPADCSEADSGTELAHMDLESDWMDAAAAGAKAKLGTWQETSATAAGTAGHFRIYDSGLAACHIQGTVTGIAGGGDMELDNVVIAELQQVTITTFTLTDANA